MLALGLAIALALAAAQYFSPASRALAAGADLRVALLGDKASVLLDYHPASRTVNAFNFNHPRPKPGSSGWKRAAEMSARAAARGATVPENIFYIFVSSAPDLDAFWGTLNNWRSSPRLFWAAARWTASLSRSGMANLSAFDLFSLFMECSRLNSSNFILTEASGKPAEQDIAGGEEAPAAPRVEVFNASSSKDLAGRTARYLRWKGFDVITASSYKNIEKHTAILGFGGDTSAALRLRAQLGLEEYEIRVRPSQKSVAEAAVILGEDFNAGILTQ